MPEPSQRLLATTAKPQYQTRVQGSVITLLEVVTKVLATQYDEPLYHNTRQTRNPNERRHDPDKGRTVHQKLPYLDEEHFGSQTLIPKPPNQNRNTKTLRKDPAEQGRTPAAAHRNPNE